MGSGFGGRHVANVAVVLSRDRWLDPWLGRPPENCYRHKHDRLAERTSHLLFVYDNTLKKCLYK